MKVVDFTKVREAKIEEKRRKYERVFFKNILGAYVVAEGVGLKAIELVDISPEGLSFQLPLNSKNNEGLNVGMDLVFRFYFSEDTYIPVGIKVMNERPCVESGQKYLRYGCAIDTKLQAYETYKLFVTFLGKYAETSQVDTGELKCLFF